MHCLSDVAVSVIAPKKTQKNHLQKCNRKKCNCWFRLGLHVNKPHPFDAFNSSNKHSDKNSHQGCSSCQQLCPCMQRESRAAWPALFSTLPTLDVDSQEDPGVFVGNERDGNSRDYFQQVGGNAPVESSHTLPGHNVSKQVRHWELRGSYHWN